MKTKFFLLVAVLAVVLMGCNTNEPEELLGTWWSLHHNESLDFRADGTLKYTSKPDTTEVPILDWAPIYADLKYSIETNDLIISGEREMSNHEKEPFQYTTSFRIEGKKLTVDSFSYDGFVNFEPLIVYK